MSSLTYKGTIAAMRLIGLKKQFSCEEAKLFRMIQEKYRPTDMPKKLYRELCVEKESFQGGPLFVLAPKGGAGNTVLLFLHGGGGIMGPTAFHFATAKKLVQATGCTMYFPFYPLAPEHTCLDALDWLKQLYEELLSRYRDSNFFFVGDSAGAELITGICTKTGKKPNGIVMISPPSGCTRDDGQMEVMEKHDPMLSMHQIHIIRKHWAKGAAPDDPRIDVGQVDFSGFPPIQLFYGTNELFYPYIQPMIERIRACGIPLEIHEGKGLCHDWPIMDFLPEARSAQKQMVAFITASRANHA